MPHTSTSLLSPTTSIVATGNQWYPRTKSDGPLKSVVYQPPIMGITAQNIT